jgi:hypothetical protein
MKQQLDASQTARDVEVLLIEAGWIQAADKRNGEPAPFLQGSPKLFVINAIHGGTEYAIGGGEDQAHRTPMDAARYLIGMIQPKEAEPVEAVAPVTYTPAAEPAPAPDTEAVNLAAENERLRARIADLESASYIDRDERPDAVEEVVGPLEAEDPELAAIPKEFRALMVDGESPAKFTERMKRRWQALKHLQIDGSKPTNARALPDMTDEEREELEDLEVRNKITRWLD